MKIDHLMMFSTFAEQRHFVFPTESSYDAVVFNANMVAHAPSGLAAFLVTRTDKLRYFIDPLTHAFQHSPSVVLNEENEIKKAFGVLADAYGEPVKSHVGSRALVPTDFEDDSVCVEFSKRVLNFQRSELLERARAHSDCKYFSESEFDAFHPLCLVAPYFFVREHQSGDWIAVNRKLVEAAIANKSGREVVYAEIVIERGLLSSPACLEKLVAGYVGAGVDGFLVWIDEFDECAASQIELRGFLELCRNLKSIAPNVINLHGGFFSILTGGTLGKSALTGVTHGPEFGEQRAVVPVGGGLPFARYYLPKLHFRTKYRDMLVILEQKGWGSSAEVFHENVCGCPTCREVLSGDIENFALFGESTPIERRTKNGIVRLDYPTQDARLRCLKHYLHCKKAEFEIAIKDAGVIRQELERGVAELMPVLGVEGVRHLINWSDVFSE